MANYTLANLVKAQTKLAGEFANNDNRYRIPAVFLLYLQEVGSFFPDYKQLKTSEKRELEANYFVRTAGALSTAGFTHDHTGTGGDSGTLPIVWQPYSRNFSMTIKQADGSIFDFQEELNNEIRQKIIDFADGLDAVSGEYSFTNRTGVNTAALKGTFNATDDVYVIDGNFKEESISITRAVADINKYQNQVLDIVCDSVSFTTFQKQAAQGAQNSTNLSFQFNGVTFVHDPLMGARALALNANYTEGFWVAIPRGMVSCLDWIPRTNRQGIKTSVNLYGSLLNPVDGLQYAVHSYETRADGTAVNGETQDVLTQTQMGIYLSFNHAPSSVVDDTPLMAFAVVTV